MAFTLSSPSYNVQPNQQVNVTIHLHSNTFIFHGLPNGGDLLLGTGERYGAYPQQAVFGTIGPGGDFDFHDNFVMTAPSSPGTYQSPWQMMVGGQLIGPVAMVTLNVSTGPQPTPTPNGWHIQYYSDRDLRGQCNEAWEDTPYLFKSWYNGAPAVNCPADNFSVRSTRRSTFQSGRYSFHVQHDDGARLYVDGQRLIDGWWDGDGGHDFAVTLAAGEHEVKVEYYDHTGNAALGAWWYGPGALPAPPARFDPTKWQLEYRGNPDLWGTPPLTIQEDGVFLNHNWGTGGPGYGLPAQNFSVAASRFLYPACGLYQFHVHVQGGVRMWVGFTQVLDQWQQQSADYYPQVNLDGSRTGLRLDYFNSSGPAVLQVDWQQLTSCPPTNTPVPTATWTPRPTPGPTETLPAYFGDGRDGDLVVGSDQVIYVDNNRAPVVGTAAAGQNTLAFAPTSTSQLTEMKDQPATQPWADTGLRVAAGERMQVANEPHGHPDLHKVCYTGGSTCYDADGNGVPAPSGWTAPGLAEYSLIGRIDNGPPFYVGPNYDAPALSGGQLYLGLNDCNGCFGDNTYYNGSVSFSFNIHITHTASAQFTPGDQVLIIQITGTNAGRYDIHEVASSAAGVLTLTTRLDYTYSTGGPSAAQVLRLPQYRSAVIQNGGIVTSHQWDGSTGGIVAFKVQTQLTIDTGGALTAFENGFAGGWGCQWCSPAQGYQGWSYPGTPPAANRSPNAGGGGGGNNAGGGGGGYGVVGQPGDEYYPGVPYGYGGQSYGSPALDILFLGSGGGGAGHGFGDAALGGSGGGAILILAHDILVNGTLDAGGLGGGQGPYTQNFAPEAPLQSTRDGGGGSGGSIKLGAANLTIGSNHVTALGGPRGRSLDQTGEGGDGGDGRIHIDYCGTLSGTTNPAADATVTPCSPQSGSATCTIAFTDVMTGHYFYDAIRNLYCAGVLSGYGDGTFRPFASTTRAQLVKIVVEAFRVPLETRGGRPFLDVPASHPFYAYIEAAANAQLISGYGDGTFRPDAPITRAQLARIVVAAAGWAGATAAPATFADVGPGDPFYGVVEAAATHGLLSGYSCGGPQEPCDAQQRPYLHPQAAATRGQVAKLIGQALAAAQGEPHASGIGQAGGGDH